MASATGSPRTHLVILRGNSASGKSCTARELRRRLGRGVAWVEQDYFRRIVLREHDVAGGANAGLIDQIVRYSLDHGYDVILDGILYSKHYGGMLAELSRDHRGVTAHYYFDISLEVTLSRHRTKDLASEVTVEQVRGWYNARDLLAFVEEKVIDETSSLDASVTRIMTDLDWTSGARVSHALDVPR